MQLATTLLAAAIAAAVGVQAQSGAPAPFNATVVNSCTFPVYVQGVYTVQESAGITPGYPVYEIMPGYNYTEPFPAEGQGRNIKVGLYHNLTAPLHMGYIPCNGTVSYDLGNDLGNPFKDYTNSLNASFPNCFGFRCTPGAFPCYSNINYIAFYACPSADLVMTVCGA